MERLRFRVTIRQLVLAIALMAVAFPIGIWIGEHLTDSPPLSILKPGDVVTVGYGYEDYKISGTYTLKKGGRCKVVRDYGKTRDDRWDRDRNVIVKVESDGKMFFLPRSAMTPVRTWGLW